jgi:hypothetical protein
MHQQAEMEVQLSWIALYFNPVLMREAFFVSMNETGIIMAPP